MSPQNFPPSDLAESVLRRCGELIGSCAVESDLSMPLGEAYVLALRAGDGRRCVAP